jgi:tripartite-type tricarboxylate transporter receptor subunit TctC
MRFRKLPALVALAGALALLGGAGLAQTSYPSAPIRVIIPLAPGGAIDVMVRALGKAFEQRNPFGFVVESRAGANTIIAANACKAAPPDGSTICLLSRSSVSLNPSLYKNLSYDPVKDFAPITNLAFAQQVLILNKNVPVKELQVAGRLFEAASRQGQFRVLRRRRRLPSRGRVAQARDRRQDDCHSRKFHPGGFAR